MSNVTVLFTCGQKHSHQLDANRVWNKDSIIEVSAPTYDEAVSFVQSKFGLQYSHDYPESDKEELLKYMPKGIVAKIQVL